MRIFFLAAEVSPFVKTRGLAETMRCLPKEVAKEGNDVYVFIPLHKPIKSEYQEKVEFMSSYGVMMGDGIIYASVFKYEEDGVKYIFIANEDYFERDRIYGEFDDAKRYIFFSKAVLEFIQMYGIKPDIIHANDWHTGLVPILLKQYRKSDSYYRGIKTVFTVHNLKYQGVFNQNIIAGIVDTDLDVLKDQNYEFIDSINMLKAGIVSADIVTTISKSFRDELMDPHFGEGLEEVFKEYSYKFHGIVNGIDKEKYNPMTDKALFKNYDANGFKIKRYNKEEVQNYYGLKKDAEKPLVIMISRMKRSKGIKLVIGAIEEMVKLDCNFIIMGTGFKSFEEKFRELEEKYPDKMAARIYYNENEARRLYAASDILLMPSELEPCGSAQMIAMRYGSLPLVRKVGGLKDTVIAYNDDKEHANGFAFENVDQNEMYEALNRALKLYYQDEDEFNRILKNAMNVDNGWAKTAEEYIKLYQGLSDEK